MQQHPTVAMEGRKQRVTHSPQQAGWFAVECLLSCVCVCVGLRCVRQLLKCVCTHGLDAVEVGSLCLHQCGQLSVDQTQGGNILPQCEHSPTHTNTHDYISTDTDTHTHTHSYTRLLTQHTRTHILHLLANLLRSFHCAPTSLHISMKLMRGLAAHTSSSDSRSFAS
jgi:hypothetical protein